MAKNAPSKPASSNAALAKRVQAAEDNVAKAQARANLVRAQIEVKNKVVVRDWDKPNAPIKVVDRKR